MARSRGSASPARGCCSLDAGFIPAYGRSLPPTAVLLTSTLPTTQLGAGLRVAVGLRMAAPGILLMCPRRADTVRTDSVPGNVG